MLQYLIPSAYAQGFGSAVTDAANASKDAAVSNSLAGLQKLVSYVASNLDNWIAGLVIVIAFFFLSKMASNAVIEAIIRQRGESVQEEAILLVERIAKITITAIGVTIALAINGLNFTAVLGALSLGIGFALKDIIGNFMSGVIMLSQDKVKIGHFIRANGVAGKIVSIDTRATILKAVDGTEVVIPNQNMLNETIINYSINPFRRVELMTYISWNSDLNKGIDLINQILENTPDILKTPAYSVNLYNLEDDSNFPIRVLFWVETGKKWIRIRSDVHRAILRAFEENNIQIDYPVQTLMLGQEERSLISGNKMPKKKIKVQSLDEFAALGAAATVAPAESPAPAPEVTEVENTAMAAEEMSAIQASESQAQSISEEATPTEPQPSEIQATETVPEPALALAASAEEDSRIPPPTHI